MRTPIRVIAVLVQVLLPAFLVGCSVAPGPAAPLQVQWTTVAEKFDTTISSQEKRDNTITLSLTGVGQGGHRSEPLIAVVSGNDAEYLKLKPELLKHWRYGGYTPVMIVADRSMLNGAMTYARSRPDSSGKVESIHPVYARVAGTTERLWWVLIPTSLDPVGATLSVRFARTDSAPAGYYTTFRVWKNKNVQRFSGCTKIANGLSYSEDAGKQMAVTPYANAGAGFHGWCYHSRKVADVDPLADGYFSVSTATSWSQIAAWVHRQFDRVGHIPSRKLPRIAKQLGLGSSALTDRQKLESIRDWMNTALHYSVSDSKNAGIPNDFDTIIKNKGGDCTDLVFVMTRLLHVAGIDAHPAVTSTTLSYPFRYSPANLGAMNHVVVYVPKLDHFLDATAKAGEYASFLTKQDVLDVVTGKILEPTKDQVQYLR